MLVKILPKDGISYYFIYQVHYNEKCISGRLQWWSLIADTLWLIGYNVAVSSQSLFCMTINTTHSSIYLSIYLLTDIVTYIVCPRGQSLMAYTFIVG